MSSAICFTMDQSKILSFGKVLNTFVGRAQVKYKGLWWMMGRGGNRVWHVCSIRHTSGDGSHHIPRL